MGLQKIMTAYHDIIITYMCVSHQPMGEELDFAVQLQYMQKLMKQ